MIGRSFSNLNSVSHNMFYENIFQDLEKLFMKTSLMENIFIKNIVTSRKKYCSIVLPYDIGE